MTRRRILFLILLIVISFSPLWGLDYGVRVYAGISSGVGNQWANTLKEAGGRGFNDVLPTLGLGVFTDFSINSSFYFTPEIGYALSRGMAMSDNHDNYIRTRALHSLELLLPLSYEYVLDEGNKAVRLSSGFHCLYSFDLNQERSVNDLEQSMDLENKSPFSLGLLLGGGLEMRRQKKMSWLLNTTIIVPLSNRISYDLPGGDEVSYKTMEVLVGSGIKF
ncbi:MAG: outer membrane beta-barrel protein [Spirochaetales bacterium]|nr:outer membrane beta-barrel protein [Spirochaetales bacterium]